MKQRHDQVEVRIDRGPARVKLVHCFDQTWKTFATGDNGTPHLRLLRVMGCDQCICHCIHLLVHIHWPLNPSQS